MAGTDKSPRRPLEIVVRFVWLSVPFLLTYQVVGVLHSCLDPGRYLADQSFLTCAGKISTVILLTYPSFPPLVLLKIYWPPLLLALVLAMRSRPKAPWPDRWLGHRPQALARFAILFVAVALLYDLVEFVALLQMALLIDPDSVSVWVELKARAFVVSWLKVLTFAGGADRLLHYSPALLAALAITFIQARKPMAGWQ